MTPNNGVAGFPLGIIFVIGLLTQFTVCEDYKCYNYRCANQDTSIIATLVPNLAPVLSQFPVKAYCAESEPVDPTEQCIQVDQDSSGCLAVIITITIPYQGETKLVFKNCTNVADCYKDAYGVQLTDGGEPKCHQYTYAQLQGGQGSPGEEGNINMFKKCAEGRGEDLTGGLGGPGQGQEQEDRQGKGRQGDLGGAEDLAKYVKLGFCICRGNMCNEHSRIDKALEMMGKGTTTTPPNNEALGLLMSKGVLSFLVSLVSIFAAHF